MADLKFRTVLTTVDYGVWIDKSGFRIQNPLTLRIENIAPDLIRSGHMNDKGGTRNIFITTDKDSSPDGLPVEQEFSNEKVGIAVAFGVGEPLKEADVIADLKSRGLLRE